VTYNGSARCCRASKLLLSLMLTPVIVPSIITAIAMYYFAGKLGLIGDLLWLGRESSCRELVSEILSG
jgi:ABC-type spermidine/putrescine transport system permease subunit II